MKWLLVLAMVAGCFGKVEAQSTPTPELPDSASESKYPHALFVLEVSSLSVANWETGKAYARQEVYDRSGQESHNSGLKYAAINIPLQIAVTATSWKLEHSHRKGLRILGHGIMWAAIGGYSTFYFTR